MANKTYALEWIIKSYHDLDSAKILFISGHFTDTTGYILHQSIEKIFKSILAYKNESIIKTHNLIELNELLSDWFDLNEDDINILAIATTYHTKQRYPSADRRLPPKEEIKKVLDLSEYLFNKVCDILKIDREEMVG